LRAELENPQRAVVLLFPDDTAMSLEEWQREMRRPSPAASATPAGAREEASPGSDAVGPLTVVLIDAPWGRARRLMHHFSSLYPHVPHLQLTPKAASVYNRQQTIPGRICTVEALALFLAECGEREEVCEGMVECIRVNNAAIKMEFSNREKVSLHSCLSLSSRCSLIESSASNVCAFRIDSTGVLGGGGPYGASRVVLREGTAVQGTVQAETRRAALSSALAQHR